MGAEHIVKNSFSSSPIQGIVAATWRVSNPLVAWGAETLEYANRLLGLSWGHETIDQFREKLDKDMVFKGNRSRIEYDFLGGVFPCWKTAALRGEKRPRFVLDNCKIAVAVWFGGFNLTTMFWPRIVKPMNPGREFDYFWNDHFTKLEMIPHYPVTGPDEYFPVFELLEMRDIG